MTRESLDPRVTSRGIDQPGSGSAITPLEVYLKWDLRLSDQPVDVGSRISTVIRPPSDIDPSLWITS